MVSRSWRRSLVPYLAALCCPFAGRLQAGLLAGLLLSAGVLVAQVPSLPRALRFALPIGFAGLAVASMRWPLASLVKGPTAQPPGFVWVVALAAAAIVALAVWLWVRLGSALQAPWHLGLTLLSSAVVLLAAFRGWWPAERAAVLVAATALAAASLSALGLMLPLVPGRFAAALAAAALTAAPAWFVWLHRWA